MLFIHYKLYYSSSLKYLAPSGVKLFNVEIILFRHIAPPSTTLSHILKHVVVQYGWMCLNVVQEFFFFKSPHWDTFCRIKPQNDILKCGPIWLKVAQCGWIKLFPHWTTRRNLTLFGVKLRNKFFPQVILLRPIKPLKLLSHLAPHWTTWRQVALFLQVMLINNKLKNFVHLYFFLLNFYLFFVKFL